MTNSKWLKWKIIHKDTGLTFNQYVQKFPSFKNKDLEDVYVGHGKNPGWKCVPAILDSGIPVVIMINLDRGWDEQDFNFQILNAKDWIIEQKTTKEIGKLVEEE